MRSVLRVGDFYAANRGGGLYSEAVSQRLGSVIAWGAARAGLKPTAVTLGNLAVGLTASATLAINADRVTPALGIMALLLWQLAYAMDCADGQLARVTGQASPAGARVDVLCDVASHIALTTALVLVARPPLWLAAVFAGSWLVNIITSILATGQASSLIASQRLPVRVLKLIRDYGALVLVAGLVLVVDPRALIWYLGGVCVLNVVYLLASLGQAAMSALVTNSG